MNPLIYQFIYLWSYLLHVFPLTIQKTNSEVTKHIPQPGQGHTHLKKNPYHLWGGNNCSCFCLPRPHQWLPFTLGFSIFCLSLFVVLCAQPITWAVAAMDSQSLNLWVLTFKQCYPFISPNTRITCSNHGGLKLLKKIVENPTSNRISFTQHFRVLAFFRSVKYKCNKCQQ